jgi:hypothetical protein
VKVGGASPYRPIDEWCVPGAAVAGALAGVADGGRGGVESGVFWRGERGPTTDVAPVVPLRGEAPDVLALVLDDSGEERDPWCWSWSVFLNGLFRAVTDDSEGDRWDGRVG